MTLTQARSQHNPPRFYHAQLTALAGILVRVQGQALFFTHESTGLHRLRDTSQVLVTGEVAPAMTPYLREELAKRLALA